MPEESQTPWLRPAPAVAAGISTRSDESFRFVPIERDQSNKCFVYLFAVFVILCCVLFAFASTVLHARNPKVEMRSASVKQISFSNSTSAPSFNGTMIALLTIKNPNFGPFNCELTKVSVLYGGVLLGDMKLGSDRLKAKETKGVNITVNLRSSRLFAAANLSSDIQSSMLRLTSYARLSGTVHLLKIVNKRKTTELACVVNLNLTSHSIHDFHCS